MWCKYLLAEQLLRITFSSYVEMAHRKKASVVCKLITVTLQSPTSIGGFSILFCIHFLRYCKRVLGEELLRVMIISFILKT